MRAKPDGRASVTGIVDRLPEVEGCRRCLPRYSRLALRRLTNANVLVAPRKHPRFNRAGAAHEVPRRQDKRPGLDGRTLMFVDTRTELEKMIAGQLYRASDPELVAARIRARRVAHAYGTTDPEAQEERRALLIGLFGHMGDDATVEPPFHCDYGWNISLGAAAYVNVNCVILDCAPVTIGALTMLGPNVQLCAATHPVDPAERERGLERALPIVIGTNVWMAASVVVGPGVAIGDNSTIGAGSIVLHDVPPNVVVAGNPARVVRHL